MVCRRCQRKGDFKAYCFTKLEISALVEVSLVSALLNTVEDETNTSCTAQIKLNWQNTVFKLDTGAGIVWTFTDFVESHRTIPQVSG